MALGGGTITGGRGTLTDDVFGDDDACLGGGIYGDDAIMTIENCVITDNCVPRRGGRAFFRDCTVKLVNCVSSDNSATTDSDLFDRPGNLELVHCTIVGNLAPDIGHQIQIDGIRRGGRAAGAHGKSVFSHGFPAGPPENVIRGGSRVEWRQ